MFTMEDILNAMLDGDSSDKIAKEFTEALNSAVQEKKRIDAEEAKRRAEAELKRKKEEEARAKRAEKELAAAAMMTAVCDFIEKFYPDFYDESLRSKLTPSVVIAAFDEAAEFATMKYKPIMENLKELERMAESASKRTAPLITLGDLNEFKAKTSDKPKTDPLADFLRKNGLF